MDAVGRGSVPRLFAALADLQRSAPKDLQWLLVLACWLSDAARPSGPSLRHQQQDRSLRRQPVADRTQETTLEKGPSPSTAC